MQSFIIKREGQSKTRQIDFIALVNENLAFDSQAKESIFQRSNSENQRSLQPTLLPCAVSTRHQAPVCTQPAWLGWITHTQQAAGGAGSCTALGQGICAPYSSTAGFSCPCFSLRFTMSRRLESFLSNFALRQK